MTVPMPRLILPVLLLVIIGAVMLWGTQVRAQGGGGGETAEASPCWIAAWATRNPLAGTGSLTTSVATAAVPAPSMVTGFSVTPITDGFAIRWNLVKDAQGYQIQHKAPHEETWDYDRVYFGSRSLVEVPNDSPYATQQIRIRAVTGPSTLGYNGSMAGAVFGPWSEMITATAR